MKRFSAEQLQEAIDKLTEINGGTKPTVNQLKDQFGISRYLMYNYIVLYNLKDQIKWISPKKQHKYKYTPEKINEIVSSMDSIIAEKKDDDEEVTIKEIAEKMGMKYSVLSVFIRNHHLTDKYRQYFSKNKHLYSRKQYKAFIDQYFNENDMFPTCSDIAHHFNISYITSMKAISYYDLSQYVRKHVKNSMAVMGKKRKSFCITREMILAEMAKVKEEIKNKNSLI